MPRSERDRLELEVRIAGNKAIEDERLLAMGKPTKFACPECHGVLMEIGEEGVPRFRCHTGHAFTAGSLEEAYADQVEETVFQAMRSLNEYALLLGELGQRLVAEGRADVGAKLLAQASSAKDRANEIRRLEQGSAADVGPPAAAGWAAPAV